MHPTPASVAAMVLLLAACALVVVTAVSLRPRSETPTVTTQAAPGPQPRAHERTSPSARRTKRRGTGRRTVRAAARSTPQPTATPASPSARPAEAEVAPEPTPAAPREAAATAPPQPPETVVESYYRALDAGRFDAAWMLLTPAVRAAFGGFEGWRAGYATTLSNSPRDIEVAREGGVATIAHELVTEDRSSCGPVRRRFAIRWRLVLAGDGWRAASLEGVKRAGPEPADACPARHDAAGGAGGV